MQISNRSWLFRIAYLFNDDYTKKCVEHTTLCALFWRTIGNIVACALVATIVFVSLITIWEHLMVAVVLLLFVGGVPAVVVGSLWLFTRIRGSGSSPLVEAASGFKRKVCPIIEVKE